MLCGFQFVHFWGYILTTTTVVYICIHSIYSDVNFYTIHPHSLTHSCFNYYFHMPSRICFLNLLKYNKHSVKFNYTCNNYMLLMLQIYAFHSYTQPSSILINQALKLIPSFSYNYLYSIEATMILENRKQTSMWVSAIIVNINSKTLESPPFHCFSWSIPN
jgi:hypothetical protein